MGVRFIYGRAGSGKSTFCLNQIKKKIENSSSNRLIMIVPEQYTFETEKNLLALASEKSILRAEVLSFKRMAFRVFEECGGRVHTRMKEEGKSMLIYKLLQEKSEELNYFNRISKKQGFVDVISKTITEFKKYNISKEILLEGIEKTDDNELKDKLGDLANLFEAYNGRISDNVIDGDDELTNLSKLLKDCSIYDDAEVWIDEFTTFTPQQMDVILMLAKRCKTVNITLCMDGSNRGLDDVTDVFNAIKNTEYRVLKMIEDNNIAYMEPIDLNKGVPYRFRESNVLAHLEKHFFTYPFKVYEGEDSRVRLYRANNSYDEVDTVAKNILKLVRDYGFRYRDIAVVCRNVDAYEKITSVIFNQYNIPYFLDKKIQVLSNPLVILIMSAIEILIKNWSYESVFKYLKSGLIGMDKEDIDVLENYVLANGIKGYRWTLEEVNEGFWKNIESDKNEIRIKEIMEYVREPLLTFHNKIKGKKNVEEICTAIYEFMVELDVFSKVNKWIEKFSDEGLESKVKEYEQVPQIIMDVLDQAVEVMGEETISYKDFYKVLNAGFQNKEIGVIPVALDQVNIGDIARVKGKEVRALYIIGVNDGVLPSASKEEGILSDKDRDVLKGMDITLASTTKARAFEEQFMVYTALTIASEYMMITYPMADFEGKALRASIIIPRLKKILLNLKEESEMWSYFKNDKYNKVTSKKATFNELVLAMRKHVDNEEVEEYWGEVYKWYINNPEYEHRARAIIRGIDYTNLESNVDREKLKSLYMNDYGRFRFDVSRLEKYAGCPFSYFVKYGLKAKDRKIYEFSSPDLGSFMHDILDDFTTKVKDESISWDDLNRDRCRNIVSELVDRKLSDDTNSILNSSNRYRYFTDRFKRIITKSISVIAEQIKRGEFEVFSNEFSFGETGKGEPIKLDLPTGERVYLTGRIDRIDTLEFEGSTYLRVVDYKSSAKKFDLNELFAGIQMQLLVYIDALIKNSEYILQSGAMPGAILYFKIDDPIISGSEGIDEEKLKEELLKSLKMEGLLLKDAKIIKAMDNTLDGESKFSLIIPARFKKDGDFAKGSSVATQEEFELLREYVNVKMTDLCNDMLSGKIKIEPIKIKDRTQCAFCDYSAICQFDTSIKDNNYRFVSNKSDDEIWEKIKKCVKAEGETDGN